MVNWKTFLSDENLERKMIKIIENEGATKTSKEKWVLDTKFGKLRISFDLDDTPAVFMKFDEHERSKHLLGANKFNGKWNIHAHDVMDVYRQFKLRIEEVKLTPIEKATRKYNL